MNLIQRIIKEIYLKIWKEHNSKSGNIHLSLDEAMLKKIPFFEDKVWLRPTKSDVERVREFSSNIYFKKSYLHDNLIKERPAVLIDIGGNIGLSSLSLVKEFKSIYKVISIEAEQKNYGLLQANFKLWKQKYPNIEWISIHGVATHSDDEKLIEDKSLNDLTGENSASGTFRYSASDVNEKDIQNAVSITSLFNQLDNSEKVIVKIDIEGGEEHLFKKNTEWIKRCLFLTAEVHDKFHPVMLNSSSKMIKTLVENDFAFVPADDVIHCYNRKIISF